MFRELHIDVVSVRSTCRQGCASPARICCTLSRVEGKSATLLYTLYADVTAADPHPYLASTTPPSLLSTSSLFDAGLLKLVARVRCVLREEGGWKRGFRHKEEAGC